MNILQEVRGKGDGHEVRCILSIENWSRWTLGFPVVYTHYGDFQFGFHEREVFAAHREIVVAVNEVGRICSANRMKLSRVVARENNGNR